MTSAGDAQTIQDSDGLPLPQRYFALLTVVLTVVMALLDQSMVNVALPTLARELGVDRVTSIWVVNAYQVSLVVCLLPFSALGDRFGCRRVYWFGLALFTVASGFCALATSLEALVISRVIQGIGASAVLSVNTALIRFIYPRRILGQGMGFNTLTVACATAAGPSVASAILSFGPWQWLFAVNLPLGVIALVAASALPRTTQNRHGFDAVGAALNALTFGALILAIDGFAHAQRAALTALECALAVTGGIILVRHQLARPVPILPLDLLRRPIIALSIVTQLCVSSLMGLSSVTMPFFLLDHLGRSQIEIGWLLTPWPLATALVAPIAGRLSDRVPAGLLGGCGMALMGLGLLAVSLAPAHATTPDIVWRVMICGMGFGLFQTPNSRAILAASPRTRSGASAGLAAMSRAQGLATGAALAALLFGLGFHPVDALRIASAIAVTAATLSALRLRLPPTADQS